MQCNQQRAQCSFRLKHSLRLPVETIVLPALRNRDCISIIGCKTCGDVWRPTSNEKNSVGVRFSVAYTPIVSLRSCIRICITYSFEYQKFDICQKQKAFSVFQSKVVVSEQRILRKIEEIQLMKWIFIESSVKNKK